MTDTAGVAGGSSSSFSWLPGRLSVSVPSESVFEAAPAERQGVGGDKEVPLGGEGREIPKVHQV